MYADPIHTKNKKANALYSQEKYEEALRLYEDALLEDPGNKKVLMNKGSTHYRRGELDKAIESYETAVTVENSKARADAHYNMGNIYNMQGAKMEASGDQQAMEKFKTARDSYIKSLDLAPNDNDAKWNLQLTQMKIKQMEQQKQDNKDNKDNKDQKQDKDNKKNKDKKDQNKDKDKNQQNKEDQDKKDQKKEEQEKKEQEEKEKQKQDQDQQQDKKEKQQEKPKPKPEKTEKDMKKEEAMRLLMQYADDDKELNKPKKKIGVGKGKKPEKDW